MLEVSVIVRPEASCTSPHVFLLNQPPKDIPCKEVETVSTGMSTNTNSNLFLIKVGLRGTPADYQTTRWMKNNNNTKLNSTWSDALPN